MALHACLINTTVAEIIDVSTEEQYQELSKDYSTLIDISDLVIQPQIGWVLNGIVLEPGPDQQVSVEEMVKSKVKFFQKEAPNLLVELYTQNTLYGITTQQSDQMFDEYQDVLIRIREGAWPTAIYRLSQKTPSGFVTQQMIDDWIALIVDKMS